MIFACTMVGVINRIFFNNKIKLDRCSYKMLYNRRPAGFAVSFFAAKIQMSEVFIEPDRFREVIVVGGGTCALAVCARLCEKCPGSIYTEDEHQRFHWLKQRGDKVNLVNKNVPTKTKSQKFIQPNFSPGDILVLDETSDNFIGQWDNQFETCNIPHLRSPMFFHLDPVNIDGLVSFAHFNKREHELKEIENVVGKEYSKHQLKKQRWKKNKKTIPAPNSIEGYKNHDASGLIDINMRDWKDYYRPTSSLFKDHCYEIINRYGLHDVVQKESVLDIRYTNISIMGTTDSGMGFVVTTNKGVYGCKVCIIASGHRGKPNFPIAPFNEVNLDRMCHTGHIIQRQVSFPHHLLASDSGLSCRTLKSLLIVGGGLTSAQLAENAINLGVDKVYLILRGPLKIKHFDFHLDWVTKYKNLKKSAFYMRDTDEERVNMIFEAREGGSINPEYHRKLLKHLKSGKLQILVHTSIQTSKWDDLEQKWHLNLLSGKDPEKLEKVTLIPNYIVFATGNKADIKSLPFLRTILSEHDVKTVEGFPCLTDNLELKKDFPLFFTGKNASLKIGPSAANLDGARLGAERIGWYIQDQKYQGKYDWTIENSLPNTNLSDSRTKVQLQEEKLDSFTTQLKLASGQINWYSLLQVYE